MDEHSQRVQDTISDYQTAMSSEGFHTSFHPPLTKKRELQAKGIAYEAVMFLNLSCPKMAHTHLLLIRKEREMDRSFIN